MNNKNVWIEIINKTDIDKLLNIFGHFHDSCLRDIYISTREFVDQKFSMCFDNKLTVSLLFQRQFGTSSVLELKFEEVEQFNFKYFDKAENTVIYDAVIILSNGLFYWADYADWEIGDNDSIWISSKKLFWRLRPELIGNINRLNDE